MPPKPIIKDRPVGVSAAATAPEETQQQEQIRTREDRQKAIHGGSSADSYKSKRAAASQFVQDLASGKVTSKGNAVTQPETVPTQKDSAVPMFNDEPQGSSAQSAKPTTGKSPATASGSGQATARPTATVKAGAGTGTAVQAAAQPATQTPAGSGTEEVVKDSPEIEAVRRMKEQEQMLAELQKTRDLYQKPIDDMQSMIDDLQKQTAEAVADDLEKQKRDYKVRVFGGVTEAVSSLANLIATTQGASPQQWQSHQQQWAQEADMARREREAKILKLKEQRDAANAQQRQLRFQQGMAVMQREADIKSLKAAAAQQEFENLMKARKQAFDENKAIVDAGFKQAMLEAKAEELKETRRAHMANESINRMKANGGVSKGNSLDKLVAYTGAFGDYNEYRTLVDRTQDKGLKGRARGEAVAQLDEFRKANPVAYQLIQYIEGKEDLSKDDITYLNTHDIWRDSQELGSGNSGLWSGIDLNTPGESQPGALSQTLKSK